MSQNTDIVKRGYDAFNSGDGETLASIFAEDVNWRGTADERVPGAGEFKSRDDALAALERTRGAFATFSSQPDEFVEQGDTVVVLGHIEAQTKAGKDLKVPFVNIWRLSNSKVHRGQLLTDTAVMIQALEA